MINRRNFVKKLGLMLMGMPLAVMGKTKSKGFKLTTLKVAGLQYSEMKNSIFVPTERLLLCREPQNSHDKYAIAIYKQETKVGYIPKANSRIIASLLDNGINLDVEVRYFNKQKPVWDRMWIEVSKMG